MELVDLQSSFAFKKYLQSEDADNFWSNHVSKEQYLNKERGYANNDNIWVYL